MPKKTWFTAKINFSSQTNEVTRQSFIKNLNKKLKIKETNFKFYFVLFFQIFFSNITDISLNIMYNFFL